MSLAASRIEPYQRWLGPLLGLFGFGLALLQVIGNRHTVTTDGISYLDLGDAVLRGDWYMALNGYFSPLYGVLLGVAGALLRPSTYWEFTVIHVVNLLVFISALCAYLFLLKETRHAADGHGALSALPPWMWTAIGHTLFIWTTVTLISVHSDTPDLCVAALVYAAAGLLLRIRRGAPAFSNAALLGLALGAAYLAKAVMFPLSLVFLATAVMAAPDRRHRLIVAATASAAFAVVAAPWLVGLSMKKGKLTFGESGRIAYALTLQAVREDPTPDSVLTVADFDPYPPAQTLAASDRLLDSPRVYSFGGITQATYPIWYDASYWHEGLQPRITVAEQLQLLMTNLRLYSTLALQLYGAAVIAVAAVFLSSDRRQSLRATLKDTWVLLLPGLAGLAIYSVAFAYTRYVAPFLVLAFLGVFASMRRRPGPQPTRLLAGISAVVVLALVAAVGLPVARDAAGTILRMAQSGDPRNPHADVARALREMGLQAGASVACLRITSSPSVTPLTHSKWARLARVRLVAAIYSTGDETDERKRQALDAVAKLGAGVVITEDPHGWASIAQWQKIDDSPFAAYFLPDISGSQAPLTEGDEVLQ